MTTKVKLRERDIEGIVNARLEEEVGELIDGFRDEVTEELKDEKETRFGELVKEKTDELLKEHRGDIDQEAIDEVGEEPRDEKDARIRELVEEKIGELLEEHEEEINVEASQEVDLEFKAEFNQCVGALARAFQRTRYKELKEEVLAELES